MGRSQAGEEGTDAQVEGIFIGTNGMYSLFTSGVVYASSSSWTNISQRNSGDTSAGMSGDGVHRLVSSVTDVLHRSRSGDRDTDGGVSEHMEGVPYLLLPRCRRLIAHASFVAQAKTSFHAQLGKSSKARDVTRCAFLLPVGVSQRRSWQRGDAYSVCCSRIYEYV